ncbi:MAG: multicopper oxidase domain-containing protein [Nakamurella sp.]
MPNKRASWHFKANAGVVFWLVALVVVTVAHRFLPASTWLLVHLLLLGAITNAIVVWSSHFADTVLRSGPSRFRVIGQTVRLWLLNVGVAAVVLGMTIPSWISVLIGGSLVGAIVLWHGITLAVRMRRALPSRFKPTVRYYLAAAALLPIGAAAGILLARDVDYDRLVVAHMAINLLGWVGITIIGTLVTLWATMLRTKIVDGAEKAASRALWFLPASVLAIAAAALWAPPPVAIIGLVGYLAGLVVALVPLVREAKTKAPSSYATYSVAAGLVWLVVGLVWLMVLAAISPTWSAFSGDLVVVIGPLAGGFAAQVLLGALSYLVPVVAGGGPVATRAATAMLDRGAAWRVSIITCGIAVWAMPVPSSVAVVASSAALVGFVSFLPLLALALRASIHERRNPSPQPTLDERREASAAAKSELKRPGRFAGPAAAGFAIVALAVAGAVALSPADVGAAPVHSAAGTVTATGKTTVVKVEAYDMRFHPQNIEVPAGNRLVIDVKNTDTVVHDLVLETGVTSGRLAPGASATVNAGIIGTTVNGWCSIVGHRQLGMVMQITVAGATGQSSSNQADSGTSGMSGMNPAAGSGDGASSGPSAASDLNFQATAPKGFTAHDATLPPLLPGRVHHVTFTVTDVDTGVAPGVKQTLWTYSDDGKPGAMPGPTLHGRVGDTFVVHLVNNGDMSHSIDFHAGEIAPDLPMRDIAPGQSLDYTFTAHRSGIWMYHCSTMPMVAHIANGMFGAVVIDPPDLAPVDKQYVLIASELYLGPQNGTVDVAKALAIKPDAVVFNGYANQYDADPLTIAAGKTVRIWVLDAGPNEPLAFHVVGGQFKTVFLEGAYTLRAGNAEDGGSQTLALQPSQGGFVEMTLAEPGHYPFISHIMANAERGEHGILAVTPK